MDHREGARETGDVRLGLDRRVRPNWLEAAYLGIYRNI